MGAAVNRRISDPKIDQILETVTEIKIKLATNDERQKSAERDIKSLKENQRSVIGAILLSFLAALGGLVYQGVGR